MRRTSVLVVGASSLCVVLALSHCSLTEDLASLSAGSPPLDASDGALLDTTTPGSDAATPPPGIDGEAIDAASSDASGLETAPPDGNPAPINEPPVFPEGGAGSTWCTSHSADSFCADFDLAPLPSGFSSLDGTLVTLTSTLPSSAPNALLLLASASSSTGSFASKLSRDFNRSIASISVEFDFRAEVLNSTSSGLLFAAVDFVDAASAKYSVRLAFNEGAPRLEESYLGSPPDVYHTTFSIPLDTWARLRLDLSFGSPPADGGIDAAAPQPTASVYVDGVLIGHDPLSPPAGIILRPTLLLGAVYGTLPHTGWTLRYDNVTADLQ